MFTNAPVHEKSPEKNWGLKDPNFFRKSGRAHAKIRARGGGNPPILARDSMGPITWAAAAARKMAPAAGTLGSRARKTHFQPHVAAAKSFLPPNPPLTCWDFHTSLSMDFSIAAVHLLGISSILNSINILVTSLAAKSQSNSFYKIHLIIFAAQITSILLIAVAPVLAVGVISRPHLPIIFKKNDSRAHKPHLAA
jgi:hypothetical protein